MSELPPAMVLFWNSNFYLKVIFLNSLLERFLLWHIHTSNGQWRKCLASSEVPEVMEWAAFFLTKENVLLKSAKNLTS